MMTIIQMVKYHTLSMVHEVIQAGKLNMERRWKGEPGEELLKPDHNQVLFTLVQICLTPWHGALEERKTKIFKDIVWKWVQVNFVV